VSSGGIMKVTGTGIFGIFDQNQNLYEEIESILERVKLLDYINPLNLQEAESAFLARDYSNFLFSYEIVPEEIDHLKKRLIKIKKMLDKNEIDFIYIDSIDKTIKEIDLVMSIGKDNFSAISNEIYAFPTEEEYKTAKELLEDRQPTNVDRGSVVSPEEIFIALENALEASSLNKWSVEWKDQVARCQVNPGERKIFLNRGSEFFETDKKKLIAHEIWGHVYRSENGDNQPIKILRLGLNGYLQTEEGLSGYLESLCGFKNDLSTSSKHIVLSYLSRHMNFGEVFEVARFYSKSDKAAFRSVLRIKRGVKSFHSVGGFTKDVIYFRGKQKIASFIEEKGKLSDLFVGKIGIEHLPLIQKLIDLKFLNPPLLIPEVVKGLENV
jgi:uncharacterized protein (TIGR02421 family)